MPRLFPYATPRAIAAALAASLLVGAAPAAPPAPSELVVLSITDLKGKTSPCGCHTPKGGFSRQASYADSVRGERAAVVWFDNGGFFPEPAEQEDVATFVMDMMPRLGVAAANVGDRDLRYGRAFLVTNARRAGLPLVSANLLDRGTKKPLVEPWRIVSVGRLKVGVFGLISDKVDLGPARDSLEVSEPTAAAQRAVAALRQKGATVIVLLSQLGKVESEDLVTTVDGIDAVVVGRNVPLLQQGRLIKNTVACYGGEQGQYMGRTTLSLDERGRVRSAKAETFMLSPEVGEKPAVLAAVKAFEDAFNEKLRKREKEKAAEQSLRNSEDSPDHFVGVDVCARCHASEFAQWQGTAHARAWKTLVDQKKEATPDCIPCHVVGYRQAGGFQTGADADKLANVQCENCHGMGTQHEAWPSGSGRITEATCRTCHNATTSPKFDFAIYQPHVVHAPLAALPPLPPRTPKSAMTGGH